MFKRVVGFCFLVMLFTQVSLFAQSNSARIGRSAGQGGEKVYQILAEDNFYSEFVALKAEVDELKVLITDLKSEISHKQSELTYLQEAVIKTSRGLNELNQQKALAQEEVRKASQTLASINTQKKTLQQEIERSSQMLANLAHERDVIQSEMSKTSQQLAGLSAQKNELNSEMAQLGMSLNELSVQSVPPTASAQQPAGRYNPAAASRPPESSTSSSSSSRYGETLLKTLYFSPDSSTLVSSLRSTLDEIGGKMMLNPNMSIVIRGYAAPAGSEKGQMRISELRAKKTAEYLRTNFGISADRITVEWVGAQQHPTNVTPSGMSKYRAVEVFSL